MKTTYKPNNQNKTPRTNWLKSFLNGDFLVHQKVVVWYPYFFLLFVLACVIVINESVIEKKYRKIKVLEESYKAAVVELKQNNYFIPYEQNQILIQKAQEMGFVKNENDVYKISMTDNE